MKEELDNLEGRIEQTLQLVKQLREENASLKMENEVLREEYTVLRNKSSEASLQIESIIHDITTK